tara:strand:+ start:172 stop:561 length:390 start_codon:yes stop_codon:yes gene_type:complete
MRIQITKNFYLDEFTCKDKSDISVKVFNNILKLATQLQIIRDNAMASITINSAYRSPKYNKKIGGASKSKHMLGKAADITITGMTPDETADFIEDLLADGDIVIGGLGRYNSFTHVDIRKKTARWDERK